MTYQSSCIYCSKVWARLKFSTMGQITRSRSQGKNNGNHGKVLSQWNIHLKYQSSLFLLFHNYLPLEKGVALHLNKIESPSPKDALLQIWLKKAKLLLRIWFSNLVNVFFTISLLSTLGKGRGPSFEQSWISFNQGCFAPILAEISLVILEKMKMWKFTDRRNS